MGSQRIAVFMPTRNCRPWIRQAISSVVSQDYRELDLYVLDDGGTDVTDELLASFPTVTFLGTSEQRGPYNANNLLLQLVESEYIGFHDADDWSAGDRFSSQVAFLQQTGFDGCGCWCVHVDLNGDPSGFDVCPGASDLFSTAARTAVPFHPTALFRQRVFAELGGFDISTQFGADTEFLWRAHLRFALGNVFRFLYTRRLRPESLTLDSKTGIDRPARHAYMTHVMAGIAALIDSHANPPARMLVTGEPVQWPALDCIEWLRRGEGNRTLKPVTIPECRR